MTKLKVDHRSSLVRFFTIEDETGGQGTPQFAQALQCFLPQLVAAHFEDAVAGESNLDVVAFLEFKGFDDSGG
jgi:hypothetical protein